MYRNMANVNALSIKLIALLLWFGIAPFTHALPTDRNQLIRISADSADLNQGAHQGVYIGHVEIDQGSTHLRAAKVITIIDEHNNKLIKAIAFGDKHHQVHVWTQVEKGKPNVEAFADKIYYYPNQNLIQLEGQALVKQNGNQFRAPMITYDIKKQHVRTQKNKNKRTTIIFHPEKHS